MAYVALAPSPRASRVALAEARWTRLAVEHPDLSPAVTLQRQLIETGLDLLDAIENGHVPRLSLPPRYVAAKLGRRVPALSAEPIPVPTPVLAPGLTRYTRILAAGGAGPAATHIANALDEGRIEPGSLLTASLNRDQGAIRQGAEHMGLSPDLLWLVAELAVSPFVHAVQTRVLSRSDQTLSSALDSWPAGFCPACGSWPALAEVETGSPVLRCSFCALAWSLPPGVCVYCRSTPPAFRPHEFSESGAGAQRCDRCHGYLKVVRVPELSPFPLVAISDLESTSLDVDAMQAGYSRPQLPGGH